MRNLDKEIKERLRIRAAKHGKSMEAEIRQILTIAALTPLPEPVTETDGDYCSSARGMWKDFGMTTDEFMEMIRGD